MAIKPILFNTDMVRAILDGRKSVTRRVAFPGKDLRKFPRPDNPDAWNFRGRAYPCFDSFLHDPCAPKCRYQSGDVLWVRETWFQFLAGGYAYKADANANSEKLRVELGYKWRPSIHMPREAARLWLRVTDVRLELLETMEIDDVVIVNSFEDFRRIWGGTIKTIDGVHYRWDANPWAWVIEFARCGKPEDIGGDAPCTN